MALHGPAYRCGPWPWLPTPSCACLLAPACLPPQVLCEGEIPLDPPCPPVTDADVRRGEVREQAQIALAQSQRMHCTVCFTRGQERQAYFAVEGLPAHMKAGRTAGGRGRGGLAWVGEWVGGSCI